MSFLVPLGLLFLVGVIGPFIAHLIRRKKPQEIFFPPTRFVLQATPVARRQAHLDDYWMFALRALAILALALIAASPLIRCQRFTFDRHNGASIAVVFVIDDSMSMQAEVRKDLRRGGAKTRFDFAQLAAQELVASLRSDDVASIVLAGAPARTLVPLTRDTKLVQSTVKSLVVSDRSTNLDGAIALATSMLQETKQIDRRIVLLSDLADGESSTPFVVPNDKRIRIEAPLEALRTEPPAGFANCALLSATSETQDTKSFVRVKIGCAVAVRQHTVEIVPFNQEPKVLGSIALPPNMALIPNTTELEIPLPDRTWVDPNRIRLLARLVGPADAIAHDDMSPVVSMASSQTLGVVVGEGGALDEITATGTSPVLEQALTTLESNLTIRSLTSIPDREVDYSSLAGLAIDDPSCFNAEIRTTMTRWLEQGGVVLLTIGQRASQCPLGMSLEPMLMHAARWAATPSLKIDSAHPGLFATGVSLVEDLAPKGRSILDPADISLFETNALWSDGSPLLLTRTLGKGAVWLVTLPFALDMSELPLRPSFLALLDAFTIRVKEGSTRKQSEPGQTIRAALNESLKIETLTPNKPNRIVPIAHIHKEQQATLTTLGAYQITHVDSAQRSQVNLHVITPSLREIDLRSRSISTQSTSTQASQLQRSMIEITPALVALVFLFITLELVLRFARWMKKKGSSA